MLRNCTAVLFLVALVAAAPAGVGAEDTYPSRPIRIIVPFPPGGLADTLPRMVSGGVARRLGQPVIVDNRPGATGNIGTELVAKAPPDGYTLLAAPPPPLVINQSLFPTLAFDPAQFVPVTVLAAVPNILVAHPSVPARDIASLVSHAKAHPGKLNYASTGNGGTPHLSAEWFKSAAEVQISHVPYRGMPQAIPALLSGEVQLMFMNLGEALPHVRAGKLTALAVAGEKRHPALPELQRVADTLPGFVSTTWYAVVAPPGTPAAITRKLYDAFAETIRAPENREAFQKLHLEPVDADPAGTAAFLQLESRRWAKVIGAARIRAD
jgi:tripartite-type tricarboxylate transporter receptor subunit TctC